MGIFFDDLAWLGLIQVHILLAHRSGMECVLSVGEIIRLIANGQMTIIKIGMLRSKCNFMTNF
jgi:hypothetical protein